jgi:hypothetical protein
MAAFFMDQKLKKKRREPKFTYPGKHLLDFATTGRRGGARLGSGRPRKPENMLVTVSLRRDTVAALKAGAGGEHFGAFLQDHLDRYRPPTREEYLRLGEPLSMGPSPLLIRKEVNKFLRQQKELEQKKIVARRRRLAKKP